MKNGVVKFGAFTILIVGIAAALILAAVAVTLLVTNPEAPLQKKLYVSIGLFILAVIISVICISAYDSMIETTRVEQELLELKEEIEESRHK